MTGKYDHLMEEMRGLYEAWEHAHDEYVTKVSGRAAFLTARFVDAGWSDIGSWWAYVCVRSPGGRVRRWFLYDFLHVEKCLKTLEAAEKAAKERAE